MQEETNEDKLPQFTTAGMRPLIDESRLLERVKHATIREDIPNQNHTRRTTTSNVQEVPPQTLRTNQENK